MRTSLNVTFIRTLPALFVRPEAVARRTLLMPVCPALSHTAGSHLYDARIKRDAAITQRLRSFLRDFEFCQQ